MIYMQQLFQTKYVGFFSHLIQRSELNFHVVEYHLSHLCTHWQEGEGWVKGMELRKEMLIVTSPAEECPFMIESKCMIIELKKIMKTSWYTVLNQNHGVGVEGLVVCII